MNARARRGGQILVVFVLTLVAIIAMVGLIIDGGGTYAQRRGQQNAADLAALAGADALANGQTQAQAITAALAVATFNGYTTGNGVTVTVTFPPGQVKVDIGAPHQNYFAGIIPGQGTWAVATTATALGGVPDTALHPAPFIMPASDFGSDAKPLAAYTQANCPVDGCVWGTGNGDTPSGPTDWAWTLYGGNVNTSGIKSYLDSFGNCGGAAPPAVTINANDYAGQHNNGMHNGAFNEAACIVGLDVAVPIVGSPIPPATTCTDGTHTDGCFLGWGMFHVTGADKHGNTSSWRGWFLDDVLHPPLTVTSCSGTSCPPIGPPILKLVN